MWIGRVGNGDRRAVRASAPLAGSMRSAVTWCVLPAGPMPEALSLVAAYRNRRDACGHTYCTFAGRLTVSRRVSVAASTSTS